MDELYQEFKSESQGLIKEMLDLLEEAEGSETKGEQLEKYGLLVDRIMGAAKTLAQVMEDAQHLEKIGKYGELCKTVGYKGSQIDNNDSFYQTVVAILLDATEMLDEMVDVAGTANEKDIKEYLSETFLDRLSWISGQFDESVRGTVALDKKGSDRLKQNKIDHLLRQLGVKS